MAEIRQRAIASGKALGELSENLQRTLARHEAAVAEPFVGVHTPNGMQSGLYRLTSNGAPTGSIRASVQAFLATLDPEVARDAQFDLESDNWRRWSNIHRFLMRHGALLEDLEAIQREAALGVLGVSLSPAGAQLAVDIMKLNGVIGDLCGHPEAFSEWLYWMSVMGEPSATEPWGWQIDGHHLIINCFVLGNQLVMTPMFMGSEPVAAAGSRFGDLRVFAEEERAALAMMSSLDGAQRAQAILAEELPSDVFTNAFRDNVELAYEGIGHDQLDATQQGLLLDLISVYVGRLRADHAALKMAEVSAHLSETYFAWMGGDGPESVFYYRVHSPVLLIEFDHQSGVVFDNTEPSHAHIHTVMRTPNGNDYGKDLLRQHYEQVPHAAQAAR